MAMIHTNKAPTAIATALLFLVVAIAPQWTEAQTPPPMPKVDPECQIAISDIALHCYSTFSALPTEECCNGLKSASKKQVSCICDNLIAHPVYANLTRPYYNQINTGCGVLDKYACDGTKEGGDDKGGNAGGGATNKIAASMTLFGLVASLFFLLF